MRTGPRGSGPDPRVPMRQLIISSLALLLPFSTLAQPGPEEIDALLAGTAGRERLGILVELATAHREGDATRAIGFGEEALELLRSHPDRVRQLEVLNSLAYAHIIQGNYQPALVLELARIGRVVNESVEVPYRSAVSPDDLRSLRPAEPGNRRNGCRSGVGQAHHRGARRARLGRVGGRGAGLDILLHLARENGLAGARRDLRRHNRDDRSRANVGWQGA